MKGPTLLVLIRHAESLLNQERGNNPYTPEEAKPLFAGMHDRDVPLTPNGVTQALHTGELLRQKFSSFDTIFHSDSVRGEDSARGIVHAFDNHERRLRRSYLLNERDPGYTFGMTREESRRHFPWLHEYWQRAGWFYARPPGGESVHDLAITRVPLFRDLLYEQCATSRYAVVTHGRWIQAWRAFLEGLPIKPEIIHGRNCGWIEYRYNWKTRQLVLHDDTHYANAP